MEELHRVAEQDLGLQLLAGERRQHVVQVERQPRPRRQPAACVARRQVQVAHRDVRRNPVQEDVELRGLHVRFSATTRSGGSAVTVKSASSAWPTSPLIRASFRRSFRSCVTAAMASTLLIPCRPRRDSRRAGSSPAAPGFGRFGRSGGGAAPTSIRPMLMTTSGGSGTGSRPSGAATVRPSTARPAPAPAPAAASAAAGWRPAAPGRVGPHRPRRGGRSFAASRRRGGAPSARAGFPALGRQRRRVPGNLRRAEGRLGTAAVGSCRGMATRGWSGSGGAGPGAWRSRGAAGKDATGRIASICGEATGGAGGRHRFRRSYFGRILGHRDRPGHLEPRTQARPDAGCLAAGGAGDEPGEGAAHPPLASSR